MICRFPRQAETRFSECEEGRMSKSSLAQLMRLVEKESIDGVKLLENPKDNPICSLSYDETIRCVTIVWRKYATSAQLRFVHEAIIQMLAQYKANKILGDDSDLPIVHAEDQKWITDDWLPRAKEAGLKAAAAKVSFAFFGKLSIGSVQARLAKEIRIKAFPNIHQARTWLQTFE
jgi:hypothetical protein